RAVRKVKHSAGNPAGGRAGWRVLLPRRRGWPMSGSSSRSPAAGLARRSWGRPAGLGLTAVLGVAAALGLAAVSAAADLTTVVPKSMQQGSSSSGVATSTSLPTVPSPAPPPPAADDPWAGVLFNTADPWAPGAVPPQGGRRPRP